MKYFFRIYRKHTLACLIIFSFILLVIINNYLFKIPFYEHGDISANALLIIKAKKIELLTGNYSRWGFYHPGPFFFYIYAMGEYIFFNVLHIVPEPYNAHIITALVFQFFLLYLSLATINRILNKKINPLILLIVSLLFFRLVPINFGDIWPPIMVIFPFLAFLISTIAIFNKNFKSITLLLFSVCILVNHHTSMLLFTIPPLIILIFHFRNFRLKKILLNVKTALNIFIILLFLIPLILDSLLLYNSNLYRILVFISEKPFSIHSTLDVFYYILTYFSLADQYLISVGCKELCQRLIQSRSVFLFFWFLLFVSFIFLIKKIPYMKQLKIRIFWKTGLGLIFLEFLLAFFWSSTQKGDLFLFNTYIMYSLLFLLFFILLLPVQIFLTRKLFKYKQLNLIAAVTLIMLIFVTKITQPVNLDSIQIKKNLTTLINSDSYEKQSITLLIDSPYWDMQITLFLLLKRAGQNIYFLKANRDVDKTLELIFNPENKLPKEKYSSTSYWKIVNFDAPHSKPLTNHLNIRYLDISDECKFDSIYCPEF